jgi:hypothetical protein
LYKPERYDIVTHTSFRGDAEWYRGKARECGGPVLELGAGTGRITRGIAQAGVSVKQGSVEEGAYLRPMQPPRTKCMPTSSGSGSKDGRMMPLRPPPDG